MAIGLRRIKRINTHSALFSHTQLTVVPRGRASAIRDRVVVQPVVCALGGALTPEWHSCGESDTWRSACDGQLALRSAKQRNLANTRLLNHESTAATANRDGSRLPPAGSGCAALRPGAGRLPPQHTGRGCRHNGTGRHPPRSPAAAAQKRAGPRGRAAAGRPTLPVGCCTTQHTLLTRHKSCADASYIKYSLICDLTSLISVCVWCVRKVAERHSLR